MKNIFAIKIKCYVWRLSFGEQIDAFGQVCHAFKQNILKCL
jgi:hypothetical protein